MASNETNGENSNASGGDDNLNSETLGTVQVNPMVLLAPIEHIDGQPVESEILTEATSRELCQYANLSYKPYAIELLSPHEICITYRQGVSLGQVAGKLMAIELWMDFPILVTVVIINRSKVDAIVEARQKYRKEWKDQELKDLEKLGQGQFDLQAELEHVATQKEVLRQKIHVLDHDEK